MIPEENIQLLRNDFDHFLEINTLQHENIIDKLNMVHEIVTKDLVSHGTRLDKLEKEVDSLKNWRIYTIAIATIIVIVIPYLIQIGLAVLGK